MCGNWLTRIARRIGLIQSSPRSSMYRSSGGSKEKRALIVVDVQNDFISGSLALSNCPSKHDGSEVVTPINKVVTLPFWDIVAYSKDWHPPDHISFVTNAKHYKPHADNKTDIDNAQVFDYCIFDVEGTTVDQVLWPAHCIQNSEGAEFHKDLKIVQDGITVHKGINTGIDSYSAFFDNNRRSETILRQVLQDAGITEVYVCGLATDVCVNFTAFDAKSLGFKTVVIEDCCRGVDADKCEETFRKMEEAGMDIVTSDEVLEKAQKVLTEEIED